MKKTLALWCAIALVVTTIAVYANASTDLPVCDPSIIECCAITSRGTYTITKALTQTTTTADCIDIEAPQVNLYSGAFDITGPGKGATGVGIKIKSTADQANVQLIDPNDFSKYSTISGFGTGIKVSGVGALVNGFEVTKNVGNGILLNNATNCIVMYFDSTSNGSNGLTINNGSGCQIDDFDDDSNGGNGILMNSAESENFYDFGAEHNSSDGISISSVSHINMEDFGPEDNGGTGISISSSSHISMADFYPEENGSNGISISSSSHINMEDFDADSNSANGVAVSNSKRNQLLDFDANENSNAGIKLVNSAKNDVSDYDADDNGTFGTWLNGSDSNIVRYFFTFDNPIAGVYLGCSSTGPGGACAADSSNNVVTSGQAGRSEKYGVAVDKGDLNNAMSGIGASGDSVFDLFDGNPNCGTNLWVMNDAGTSDPSSCISTTP
jgi:hypothetical protein